MDFERGVRALKGFKLITENDVARRPYGVDEIDSALPVLAREIADLRHERRDTDAARDQNDLVRLFVVEGETPQRAGDRKARTGDQKIMQQARHRALPLDRDLAEARLRWRRGDRIAALQDLRALVERDGQELPGQKAKRDRRLARMPQAKGFDRRGFIAHGIDNEIASPKIRDGGDCARLTLSAGTSRISTRSPTCKTLPA